MQARSQPQLPAQSRKMRSCTRELHGRSVVGRCVPVQLGCRSALPLCALAYFDACCAGPSELVAEAFLRSRREQGFCVWKKQVGPQELRAHGERRRSRPSDERGPATDAYLREVAPAPSAAPAWSKSLTASAPCVTAAPARRAAASIAASVTSSRVAPAFLAARVCTSRQ